MHIQGALPAMVATGGNDAGFGMGGGLIGGLVLGSLLRNGNLLGNGTGVGVQEGCVTPSNLSAQLAGVTDTLQNTSVMQTLGDIKASVPLAESQVQLALAGATSDIRSHIGAVENTLVQGQMAINQNVSNAIAASLASQGAIKETVLTTGAANLQATANAQFALSQAIAADGAQTRALIQSIETANTQRLLGERQDEINELRNEGRRRDDRHGIDITMIQNNNQQQLQAQQQQQQIANLTACLHGVSQLAQATNQQLIIGNTGVASGGNQSSNPVNVRA